MSDIKISAICRSDQCGLGTLSEMFNSHFPYYRCLSLAAHSGRQQQFQNTRIVNDLSPTVDDFLWVSDGSDILLLFEFAYTDKPLTYIKKVGGCKIVLIPMYECTYLHQPWYGDIDLCICPTTIEVDACKTTPGLCDAKIVELPIPFNIDVIDYTKRTSAKLFVHRAGHLGSRGRNATIEVLEAWKYVKSDAQLLLRHQDTLSLDIQNDWRIIDCPSHNAAPHWSRAWDVGDVLIHPTKFDALSLPLQEAMAAGMLVLTSEMWHKCNRCPPVWTVPGVARDEYIARPFIAYDPNPVDIAEMVDKLYCTNSSTIEKASRQCRAWAERYSWANLTEQYLDQFNKLLEDING